MRFLRRLLSVVSLGSALFALPVHALDVPMADQATVGKAANRAKLHVELGQAYLEGGRMAVALEEANTAISADASYAPAYNLLGLVYMFLRESELAGENFQKALRLAPNDPDYSNNYGWFLCQEGKEKESFPYFLAAVRNPLYPTPTRPYYNAGICALRLKDTKLAEDYFMRALARDPRNMKALYQVADLRYRAGNYLEARQMVGDVLAQSEADPAPIWLALRIERRLGNREEELVYARQLRSKFAGSPQHQAMMQGKFE